MKICAAQTRPVTGDIQANIARHQQIIEQAVADGVELIVFPELSLTGYEPALARGLAMEPDDSRCDELQRISDTHRIAIGVGAPTKGEDGICISMLIFQPRTERRVYSKRFLHADEKPFFVPGRSSPHLQVNETKVALAICYEISVPEHLDSALQSGPAIYLASVAKFVNGFSNSIERLGRIAAESALPVLMANCVGVCDGQTCAGRTSVWSEHGELIGQLNDSDEGILILDTKTHSLIERVINQYHHEN